MESGVVAKLYLSRQEAAEYLGVGTRSVDSAVVRYGLAPIKIGRRVIFSRRELDRFMTSRSRESEGQG